MRKTDDLRNNASKTANNGSVATQATPDYLKKCSSNLNNSRFL
jgi:hypothetical protein